MVPVLKSYFQRIITLCNGRHFDLIWVEKELLPYVPVFIERMMCITRAPYVVDYDDAIFHGYDTNSNGMVRTLLSKKIDCFMRNASMVITGNEYLASRARRARAKRIEIIPTVVNLEKYPSRAETTNADTFVIGWIGSPATAKYISLIEPALAEVSAKGSTKVRLIGSGPLTLKGVQTEICKWSETSEVVSLQGCDIGIMPLPDEPWERGKCGYKLIQYMACAKPVVASPVGVNRQIVEEGVNGFCAATLTEWVIAINLLRASKEMRVQMGLAGRRRVENSYCLSVTAPHLLNLLIQAAGKE